MADDSSFDDLMSRLRAGDSRAATELFDRFSQRLIALARSRLDRLIRRKEDPEDVLQSVFKSFFLRQEQGRWELLDSWDSLWGLLTVITLRKCGHRIEFFQAAKRDVTREVGEAPADASWVAWQAVASDPTPSEAAILAETVDQLLAGMEERDRPVLLLSLQGYSPAEISGRIGRTERTVYRVLERVRKKLERQRAEESARA